jgi:hypothetical protein
MRTAATVCGMPADASLLRRVGELIYVSDRDRSEARKRVLKRLGLSAWARRSPLARPRPGSRLALQLRRICLHPALQMPERPRQPAEILWWYGCCC